MLGSHGYIHSFSPPSAYNYDKLVTITPFARVTGSTFLNNSVETIFDQRFSTTQVLQELIFPGRGGGMAVIVNGLQPADILIEDCHIEKNYAVSFGGGIYTLLDGLSEHVITINRTEFIENSTPGSGGGLEIGFRAEGTIEFTNSVLVYDSNFTGNMANYGGGAYFVVVGRHSRLLHTYTHILHLFF